MSIERDLNIKRTISSQVRMALNIMYTGHWLTDRINRILKPMGLTEPQFNVLAIVYTARGDAITATTVKEGMVQRESNVTRIVDKLVERDLLTRETCPTNRRKVDIRITGAGRELFRRASREVSNFHKELEGAVPEEDRNTISGHLDRLRTY